MSLARNADSSRPGPFLVLAVTALVLFFARDLLVPFAFALTLAFLLAPAVSRLEDRHVPRILAVVITGVLAFTIICGVGYVVARQLLNVASDLPAYRLSIQTKIASVHSSAGQSLEKAFTAVEDISADLATGAGNAAPSVQKPLPQARPVLVLDPDRTQLESTAEFLMRFLPGRQAPQLCLAVEASNGIVLRPGGLALEVGNFAPSTIDSRSRTSAVDTTWKAPGDARLRTRSLTYLNETLRMFATISQWAKQTSPTTAD